MGKTTGTQPPTVDESAAALRELLSMVSAEDPVTIQVMDHTLLRGLSIHAQVEHTVALTRSILLLVENGMFIQSMPLVRMSMECAVTAAWMAVTPFSGAAAAHDGGTKRLRLLKDLAVIAGEPDADDAYLQSEIAEFAKHASAEARIFQQRCESLVGAEWMYGYYRLLSEFSHAGSSLIDSYMEEMEDDGLAFADLSKFRYTNFALALQVVLLHIALTALDEVADGHPNAVKLKEIGERLGIQSNLRRKSK
ncbi:DUF5677 domain-containing protein [Micrococcaceae bacterium Sec5.7]